MSYIPSSDDDSTSIPLNKSKKHRGNINHSKKYIQPKNNNTTGTESHTKIKNSSSRNKKFIISKRSSIHKINNQNKTEHNQKSKNLVITNRTKNDKLRNSNNSNINSKNNNSTDNNHNDGSYGINRINNNNEIRREKQSIKEGEYNEKTFRHLRSIESRIKTYSKRKNKNRQEQTGTHQNQNRKHLAVHKTRPPKIQKTPKFYFSHVPKFCTTNVETVDQSIFSSLFHEEITPLDDPT